MIILIQLLLSQLAFADGSDLNRANELYQAGNCTEAIPVYEKLRKETNESTSKDTSGLISFRLGYCQFALGDFEKAKVEFEAVSKDFPDNLEAKLRLADTYLFLQQYDSAISTASQIQSGPLQTEAQVLIARANLEANRPAVALNVLIKIQNTNDWRPVIAYWSGVTNYQLFELEKAVEAFNEARKSSTEALWVKSAAESWLSRLETESWPVRPSLSAGLMWDSNVPRTNEPVSDRAVVLNAGATFNVYQDKNWKFSIPTNAYGNFYSKDETVAYNYETLSVGIDASRIFAPSLRGNFSTVFLDSRLHNLYYQDYWISTASVYYQMLQSLSLFGSFGLTRNVNSNSAWTFSPTLTSNWVSPWFNLWGSLSYSKTYSSDKATIVTSPYFYAKTGRVASNYSSFGPTIGISRMLPFSFQVAAQGSLTYGLYDDESIPGVQAIDSRVDKTLAYTLSLSREIYWSALTAALAYSRTKNISRGPQLCQDSSGYIYSYNFTYDRSVTTLTLSLSL